MEAGGSAAGAAARSHTASRAEPPGGESQGRARRTSAAAPNPARRPWPRRAPASARTPSARTRSRSRPPRRRPPSGTRTAGVRTGLTVASISATFPRCGRSPAGSSGRPSSSRAMRPAIRAEAATSRVRARRNRTHRRGRLPPSRMPAPTSRRRSGETAAVSRTQGTSAENETVSSRFSPTSARATRGQGTRSEGGASPVTGGWGGAGRGRSACRALRGRAGGGRTRRERRRPGCGRRRRSRPGRERTPGFPSRPPAARSFR